MQLLHTPPVYAINIMAALIITIVFIVLVSFIREPYRQQFNALLIAGAGTVYWNAGLGGWEYVFGTLMTFIAFKGLSHYYWIGVGWLLHTCWDLLHHFYATPIIPASPSSSMGCAVCDSILAAWFFLKAPGIIRWIHKTTTTA